MTQRLCLVARPLRCAAALLLGLIVVGCAKPTYPVKGRVVYKEDGKPIPAGVYIWFESTEPPYDRASAIIEEDGQFSLSTIREGSGAIAGEHRIRFAPPLPVTAASPEAALAKIMHPRYYEYRTSGLKENIATKENLFTIEVEKGR